MKYVITQNFQLSVIDLVNVCQNDRVVLFRLPLAISTGTLAAENRLHPREISFSNKSISCNIKTNKVM
jgi:hypothetical protein